MDRKKFYVSKHIETEPLSRDVMVHGAMNYKCEDCGKEFTMWLEKGLEDKMQDLENPKLHKPVPFTIGCLCGGMASHVMWNKDIHLDGYRPLGESMSYFENSTESECGIPHIRKDTNIRIHGGKLMSRYKGVVREIYDYEIEIEAEDGGEAIEKLKALYNSDKASGTFVADATTYVRSEFSLKK